MRNLSHRRCVERLSAHCGMAIDYARRMQSTPEPIMNVANVWRRSWKVRSNPFIRQNAWNPRVRRVGWKPQRLGPGASRTPSAAQRFLLLFNSVD